MVVEINRKPWRWRARSDRAAGKPFEMPTAMKFGRTTRGRESQNQRLPMRKPRKNLKHEIARWPTLRDEFPLPAERGEGQGEGCLRNTRSFPCNAFKAFPSPRPSPRSFLAWRGRRRSAACSPCLYRLSCALLCKLAAFVVPVALALVAGCERETANDAP